MVDYFDPSPFAHRYYLDENNRLNASSVIDNVKQKLRQQSKGNLNWITPEYLKDILNNYKIADDCLRVPHGDYGMQFDFVPSNLGKGGIFYFICAWCEEKTKYLYLCPRDQMLKCRKCARLVYNRRKKPET